jgi:hypothetical protein
MGQSDTLSGPGLQVSRRLMARSNLDNDHFPRETLQRPTTLFLLVVHDTKRTQLTFIHLTNIHHIHCIILSIHRTNILGRPLTVARHGQPMIIRVTQGQAHIWITRGSSIPGNP